ncbi:hypothetical protein evm_000757 [Chilo suppressalis]|nr:hypothetical protein evm_000757 [Chilo suppressalis]
MRAKIAALIICLFGAVSAGNLYGAYGSAYDGAYSGAYGNSYGGSYAIAPSYTALSVPIVKTIAPIAYSAPAVSSVSQYSIHSAPIVKSYSPIVKSYAPVPYAYSAPIVSHSYSPALSYGYGGYSGYGKLGW